jgi:hypothetical protein
VRVRWYVEDGTWYGYTADPVNHSHLVFQPEPGVWAGYLIVDGGMSKQCITADHSSAADAKREVEEEGQ